MSEPSRPPQARAQAAHALPVSLADVEQARLATVLPYNLDAWDGYPAERERLYALARKHCGQQAGWRVSVEVLLKKSGSASPRRVFRAMLRDIIARDSLPDYVLVEEPGDMIAVSRRDTVVEAGGRLLLKPETLDEARRLAPGADVYALEADWQVFARRTPPRNPDKAFLGWVAKRG